MSAYGKTHSVLVGLLFLAAVGFSCWNFWAFSSRSHALPSTVALYNIKAITQNDAAFYDPATSENIWKYEEFGKNLFDNLRSDQRPPIGSYKVNNMNDLQIAKGILGCYGDLNDGRLTDVQGVGQLGHDWDNSVTALTELGRTQLLNYWQKQAVGTDARTVCGCIDRMYYKTLLEGAADGSDNNSAMKYVKTTYKGQEDTAGTEFKTDATTTVKTQDDMLNGAFWANIYDEVSRDTSISATETDHTNLRKEILDTCIETAMPVQALAYEEVVPASLYLFLGGLLLVLSAMSIYSNFICEHMQMCSMMDKDPCDESNYEKRAQNVRMLKAFLLLVVGVTGVFYLTFVDSFRPFVSDDASYMSFRTENYQHPRLDALSVIVLSVLCAAVVIVLGFDWLIYKREKEGIDTTKDKVCADKYLLKGSVSEEVGKHIANDVLVIAGFGITSVGIVAQADITSTTSVVGSTLLIITLGFLQHISNVIKCVYTRICERLDSQLVIDLSAHDPYQAGITNDNDHSVLNEGVKSKLGVQRGSARVEKLEKLIRPTLQYFGWSRVYLFLTVIIGTLIFVFIARDTPYPLSLHNMTDGQFLYFAFAFLLANIGFDAVYELMPFMFEGTSTEWLRCYTLLFYVAFLNLNQLLYYYKLPDATK